LVDNVCILAFSQKAKPIAIVVPDEKALRNFVEKNSIADKSTDFEELVKRDDVKAIVMKDILAAGKISGLQGIELVSGVILAPDIWTPENVTFFRID
jgi:long-chain acyl-CoA synthetase